MATRGHTYTKATLYGQLVTVVSLSVHLGPKLLHLQSSSRQLKFTAKYLFSVI